MKKLRWLLFNGLILFCTISGLYYRNQWAYNVLVFIIWLVAIICTLGLFDKESRANIRKAGRSMPVWLTMGVDLSITVMLAGVGHFVLATAMFWQMVCESAFYEGTPTCKSQR